MSPRLTAASLVAGLALLAAAAPARAADRSDVAGTTPTYLHATTTRDLGHATGGVHFLVALAHRDQAGLERRIAAVSDPHDADYGHYLTPAQFVARYAPSEATVAAVGGFLRDNGLEVRSVPGNRAYVEVAGTVAQAEAAFHTTIDRFHEAGADVQAPATPLSVPAVLGDVIVDVSGLDTGDVARPQATPPPAFVNPPTCSPSWAAAFATDLPAVYGAVQPLVPCGYSAKQVAGAYGLTQAQQAGVDGTGQTVAVIDAYSSPRIETDAAEWSRRRGLPAPKIDLHDTETERNAAEVATPSVGDLPIVGPIGPVPVQDPQGWAGEETLDVEAIHATAPGATIEYQGAESPVNSLLQMAQNDVVMRNTAQIISNSYGGTTDDADATSDMIWQQAAVQGIGVYFSSGDAGDETAGGTDPAARATDAGGNSPYVTAVGGTTLAVDAQDGYEFETYWGTASTGLTADGKAWDGAPGAFNSGGGGGTSQAYAQPDYQKGRVPDQLARYWQSKSSDDGKVDGGAVPGRVTPDVAMLADPNSGFEIGLVQDFGSSSGSVPSGDQRYGEYRIGGTSLSSPLFAGTMALADQAAGMHHGFANPALYQAGSTPGASAFHDVTPPDHPVAVVRTNYDNNVSGATTPFLRTAAQLGTLTSQAGYDDSTGLGSPNGLAFLRALAPSSTVLPADPGTGGATQPGAGGAPGPGAGSGSGTAPAPDGGSSAGSGTPTATDTTTAAVPGPVAPAPGAGAIAPTACVPPARLRYLLHAGRGQRVIRVLVSVAGKRVLTRRGHRLTRVTVTRPAGKATFTVVVQSTTNRGAVTRSRRTYTESGCRKTAPALRHLRTKHH